MDAMESDLTQRNWDFSILWGCPSLSLLVLNLVALTQKNELLTYLQQIKSVQWETACTQEGASVFTSWVTEWMAQVYSLFWVLFISPFGSVDLLFITKLIKSFLLYSYMPFQISEVYFLHPESSLLFCRLGNKHTDALLLKRRTASLAVTMLLWSTKSNKEWTLQVVECPFHHCQCKSAWSLSVTHLSITCTMLSHMQTCSR